ncbi:MAG: PAS domain S-box protein [Actinobacteria bacterium]|nr:PAS domain S-box protein [Actinomycetota bacterium]
MVGKTGKDAARLKEELAELRRRKNELESTQSVYKRLAEELSHGEDLFRSMADSANDAILVLDEQGSVIYINQTGEHLFGQSADEVVGRHLHETLIPERFRDYSSRAFAAHSTTGMKGMLGTVREFQALRKNGGEFPVEVSISAFESGERTYYITFCRDITERKQADEELRESQQKYRNLVENLNDVVFTLDPLGRFSYISPMIESITHHKAEEVIGWPFTHLVHPDDVPVLLASLERTLDGQQEPLEFRVLDKEGGQIHVRTSSRPLFKNGELIGTTGVMSDISKRKQAEEELARHRDHLEELVEERTRELGEAAEYLRSSQSYYRSLIRNAPDMIDILNEDLTIRWGSISAGRITGYTPEEIYGNSILDYVHPDDIPTSRELLDRVLENPGKPQDIVVRFRHRDGSYHYHETIATNLLQDAAVKGIVLNSRDITDRMQLGEELHRSERYFRALIENAYDIIAVLKEDGTMGYLSPSLERISGFKQEERLGEDAFQFFHPDDLPRVMEAFARGLRQPGHTDVVEYRWQHRDGSWHWQEAIATNLIDDPVVRGIVVNARDITDRKKAEAAMRESEERYRSLVETSPDCIIMADLEGKILMVNRSGLRLFRCSDPSQMVGKSFVEFMVPEEIPKAREPLREQVDLLETPIELTSIRPDGSRFISESNSRLLRNAQGDPIGFISVTRDITERKRAELALRDSEERYRSLVETSPDCIIMTGLDAKLLMINRSGVALYGYKDEEEMLGKHLLDFFAPKERVRVREVMSDRSYAEQRATRGEYVMLRRDGAHFYAEVVASLVRNAEGRPVGFLGISRDITDRKIAEQALRESEEKLKSIFLVAPVGIGVVSPQRVILDVNERICDMLGYSRNELVGKNTGMLYASEDDFAEVGRKLYEEGRIETASLESRWLRKDGTVMNVLISSTPLDLGDSRPTGIFTILDITDRKRAEERLLKLNECFLSLGTDPLENIKRFVLAGRDILEADLARYGRIEKGGFYIFSSSGVDEGFGHLECTEDCLCYNLMSRDAAGPIACNEVAHDIFIKDPDVREHGFRSCLFYPVRVHGDKIGCFNMLDREERQYSQVEMDTLAMLGRAISIEEERYAFNESLRDFVDVASHELRHPVALLSGFTETLESHGVDMDELTRQEVIDAIRQSAERISHMVEGLLKVSLTERERFVILKRPVDLVPLLERVLREMRQKLPGRMFNSDLPAGAMECEADMDRIHSLLVILLDNAAKYSPDDSEVTLDAEVAGGELIVSVLDRGIGVPAEHRDKVFERFHQVEEAQYHSSPGLGLGLYLARQIVEAHGGRIWYEPRGGGGSAFRFSLPCS